MAKKRLNEAPALKAAARSPILTYILALVFFLLICLCVPDSIKITAMLLTAAALAAIILRFSVLRERIGIPFLALTLVVLMGGLSTLYAVSTKFALSEFLKFLAAYCLTILLLAFAPTGEGAHPARWIASILEGAGALAGLVSIDLLSTHIISTPVLSFLGLFSSSYENLSVVETGVRLVSIFANPNIFASSMGLAVLLSLSLAVSSEKKSERRVHLCLLFLNSISFLLAFSMGASASIAVGFILYLILERKERRGQLFALMLETLLLVVLAVVPVSSTALTTWDGFQPIPLLCVLIGAAALCLLDEFVGLRVVEKMKGRGKLAVTLIAALLAAAALFLVLALTLTGSYTLDAGGSLRRAAYPEPGSYTLSSVYEGDVSVTIRSQNQEDTMMHTSTTLYKGQLSDASFTVPEDSLVVYFDFSSKNGATMDSVTYDNGSDSADLPLDYTLLPGFIATRLQGLFANENAIQRLVFFQDGLKLFAKNPLFGRGLGAFENGVKSVQSFYYETKYAHNHYIQSLVDTGVVGLLLFLFLLVSSAIAIWRELRKKEEAHPFAPMLGAALGFIAVHCGTEMIFSAYSYLPTAFGIFALINLCCGSDRSPAFLTKKVRTGIWVAIPALLVAFAVLLAGNLMAERLVDKKPSFASVERAIELDHFESMDYMLTYINSAILNNMDGEVMEKAENYMLRLSEYESNSIPRYLALYYLTLDRMEDALPMLEKYVNYVSSDSSAWNLTFEMLEAYEEDTQVFRDGVAHLYAMMLEWDEQNMGTLTLSEDMQAFIDRVCG